MKFTLSWLGTYISLDGLTPEQLAERLTMLGLEVDAVEELYVGLDAFQTAKVLSVAKHPNADRLSLCEVEIGDETVPIVCGASNVRPGLITAIARPGVKLPGGMKIKKAKVRGEVSLGMLCSWRELGIGEEHAGIIELDSTLASGQSLAKVLELSDTMIEIDLTPNRPDCTAVLGIAREVAGFTEQKVNSPISSLPELGGSDSTSEFTVKISEPGLCPRYAARKLTNVRIQPSPWWLQRQLLAVGMRPINNIVDITNFVMLEYGQPLHAFDFQELAGSTIEVRCPKDNETAFTTLDDTERTINSEMLMICDAEKPVAVAGVMGGLHSEVTEGTTEILLESACFDPVSVRRTARNLNLSTEASYRFERGINPDGVTEAMERAVQLICELAGAQAGDGVDLYPGKKDVLQLDLRVERVNTLLGIQLTGPQIATYLRGIDFIVADEESLVLAVTVPAFRVDIEREVDLVEELARLVGYDEIPTARPNIAMDYPQKGAMRQLRQESASVFTRAGFYEAINYSFVSEKHGDMLALGADDTRRNCVRLLNPLTEDQSVLRTMLLPGILENIRRNINFQQFDIRLFEIGKVFTHQGDTKQPSERYQLCAVVSGARYPASSPLYFSEEQADIYDMKGAVRGLIQILRLQGKSGDIQFQAVEKTGDRAGDGADISACTYADASFSLRIMNGEEQLGLIGKLSKKAAQAFSIKQDVFFVELELDPVLELPKKEKAFTPLSRYPSVKRDIALLVPESVGAGELLQEIRAHKKQQVVYVDIFDVYSGKPIDEGMKSVALTVTYRSDEKTLDDATVDGFHKKIVNALMSRFGGRYREGKE